MPDPVELLTRLISIPSVNPEDTADPAITGEHRLAEFLGKQLEMRGFSVDLAEVQDGRPNVVATAGSPDAEQVFLVEVHTDTVSVANMSIPPFDGDHRDGRVWGRGACDNKGPMAASLCALTPERVQRICDAGWTLVYVGAMGEEKGNEGARHLVKHGNLHPKEALILEPTDLEIVTAHKGVLWFSVDAQGRAGHGSDPGKGVNAIVGAMSVINLVRDQCRESAARLDSSLGKPTLNVGHIEGGSQVNIIPDQCRIQFDRRLVPGEKFDDILVHLTNGLEHLVETGILTGFHLATHGQGNPFETSTHCDLVKRLQASLVDEGRTGTCTHAAWFSDAGPLAEICDELVVFGPGSIRQAHTSDEYIDVAELRAGVSVMERFFDRLAGASTE